MIRVGKLTLDGHDNYGNKLQNYALQVFLKKYADRVDTLWHSSLNIFDMNIAQWPLRRRIQYACMKDKFEERINHWQHDAIRKYRFKQFDDRYIHTKYDYVGAFGSNIAQEYDFFVVGSDQVWNPYEPQKPETVFLTFAPAAKRIAYAASFGVSEIPGHLKKDFSKYLQEMAAVSVREQRGAEIVRELTGRNVPVLIDPTMLLTNEEWNSISRRPIWMKENYPSYILSYFLGVIPEGVRHRMIQLAEKWHLQIIDLMDERHLDWYCSEPAEFLYLVSHANLVYTDSFHGAVFSILYHRPFVICDRKAKRVEKRMNSRIETLLALFHLQNRYGTDENQYAVEAPFEINFGGSEQILAEERRKSDRFIREAMGFPMIGKV